jgi:hypothetical protein
MGHLLANHSHALMETSMDSSPTAALPTEAGPRPVQIGGVVLAAILPGIGVLVGLIMLAKKEPRTGLAMIVTSLLSYVFLFQVLPLLLGRSA